MKDTIWMLMLVAYHLAGLATFVLLTFVDNYVYTAWHWIIAAPINTFLSGVWPLDWGIIRPFFHFVGN